MTILSTKILTPSQRDLILGRGYSVVDYNAIETSPLPFEIPQKMDKVIFSSKNAVKYFFDNAKKVQIDKIFCVGNKTERLLMDFGQKVTLKAQNSTELADLLAKTYQNEQFWFVCAEQRLDVLPKSLKLAKNSVFELKIYQTRAVLRHFEQKMDAILFFSPSGVRSYFSQNRSGNAQLICIGGTTAKMVNNYANTVHIANQATVESVIAKTIKVLSHDQK